MIQEPNLIIEPPVLTDEAVASLQDFLYTFIEAFDSHYEHRLRRYYHRLRVNALMNNSMTSDREEPPF
jgi:predicted outer membrane protein